jgi:iron complex outermembrane receptor protein
LGGADLAQAEQPASSDIVVTARRRDEPLLRTPGSASVRSGEDLNASGVHTVSGLLPEIPNASLAGGIGGELQGLSSVRGVSSLVRVVGIESGLGVYVDGVFVGRPDSFNLNLFGAERVELLRGPQQTFFGRNAIAGVINIVTPMPDEHFHAAAQFGVGDYNLLRLQTYASGQIADDLYGSVALQRVTRDGVVEHAGGGRNLDDLDNGSYRIKLRATPTPTLEATLTFDGLVDHGHPAFFEVSDANIDHPSQQ